MKLFTRFPALVTLPLVVLPVLALSLLTTAASAAVDPELLAMAPPDTRLLIGMQVQRAVASPFGQYALSRMPDQGSALLRFAAATGFDVRRDLRELLLASPGRHSTVGDGIILARGTFQMDKLLDLAGAIHATTSTYGGVSLITPADPGSGTIAILDSSTLAMGSRANLEGVINRRTQRFLFSGPLADKAQAASADADVWFATVTPLMSLMRASGGPWPAPMLQAVLESTAGLRFDSGGITLSAEALTHSANEATALTGLLKIVSGMVKGSPAAALQNARFTTDGPVTRVTVVIPEPDLEQAFPGPAQGRAAR